MNTVRYCYYYAPVSSGCSFPNDPLLLHFSGVVFTRSSVLGMGVIWSYGSFVRPSKRWIGTGIKVA